jgi:hypothetical protein
VIGCPWGEYIDGMDGPCCSLLDLSHNALVLVAGGARLRIIPTVFCSLVVIFRIAAMLGQGETVSASLSCIFGYEQCNGCCVTPEFVSPSVLLSWRDPAADRPHVGRDTLSISPA